MKSIISPLLATAALCLPLFGQENDLESRSAHLAVKPSAEVAAEGAKQSPETLARLDSWFTDAKFGVFIHFGVYCALEGEVRQGNLVDMRATPASRFKDIVNHL
jgi:hypothetical protein